LEGERVNNKQAKEYANKILDIFPAGTPIWEMRAVLDILNRALDRFNVYILTEPGKPEEKRERE